MIPFDLATPDNVRIFTEGRCALLAHALHIHFGYGIAILDGGTHFTAVSPQGWLVDIEGVWTDYTEFLARWDHHCMGAESFNLQFVRPDYYARIDEDDGNLQEGSLEIWGSGNDGIFEQIVYGLHDLVVKCTKNYRLVPTSPVCEVGSPDMARV